MRNAVLHEFQAGFAETSREAALGGVGGGDEVVGVGALRGDGEARGPAAGAEIGRAHV